MAHTVKRTGVLIGSTPYIKAGNVLHRLPKVKAPVCDWIAELDICPQCDGDVCDCVDVDKLLAALEADPHGELDRSMAIPY